MDNVQIRLIKELTMSGEDYLEALSASFDQGWDEAIKATANDSEWILNESYIQLDPKVSEVQATQLLEKYYSNFQMHTSAEKEILTEEVAKLISKELRQYVWDVSQKIQNLADELFDTPVDAEVNDENEEVPF